MSEGAAYKHDLWVACLHEAAHVVIARELGYLTAHMRIYRNPNPGRWQKHITGQSYWHERMSSDDRCMVALAGQVAEYLDDLSDWNVASGRDLDDLLQDGELTLSDTDAEAAGRYVEADLGRCIDLVRAHWDRIQSKSREAFEMGPREPPERR